MSNTVRTDSVVCSACGGTGRAGSSAGACYRCKGYGQVIAYVTASGHEITDPSVIKELRRGHLGHNRV